MDPVFFEINWPRTVEVLTLIVILSFIVERVLVFVFENEFYENRLAQFNIKPLIAFGLSYAICHIWEFDSLAIIMASDKMTIYGYVLTAGIIAGGSKGALQLLRNVKALQDPKYVSKRAAK